jgi:hypothetical protein
MLKIPELSDLKSINNYSLHQQLLILKDICNKIYIARNITLNNDEINHQMQRIDKILKDTENYN